MKKTTKFTKEFPKQYHSPVLKSHLEEQGWKHIGNTNGKPIFEYYYI